MKLIIFLVAITAALAAPNPGDAATTQRDGQISSKDSYLSAYESAVETKNGREDDGSPVTQTYTWTGADGDPYSVQFNPNEERVYLPEIPLRLARL